MNHSNFSMQIKISDQTFGPIRAANFPEDLFIMHNEKIFRTICIKKRTELRIYSAILI